MTTHQPEGAVTKAIGSVAPVDDSQSKHGEFDVILSTKTLDRDGDQLHPDEWQQPLPDKINFDSDHGMSVASCVGSGKPFINDDGQLQVRGTFASTPHGQAVRALVKEGHIDSVSVAFRPVKNQKGGKPSRELLNGAFVAVPANPEAKVLQVKAAKEDAADDHHDSKEPYGSDAGYADPGFRGGVKRYPLKRGGKLDPERVRAAWDYFHHAHDRNMYSDTEQAHIEREIEAAAKKCGVKLSAAAANQKAANWQPSNMEAISDMFENDSLDDDHDQPCDYELRCGVHQVAVKLGNGMPYSDPAATPKSIHVTESAETKAAATAAAEESTDEDVARAKALMITLGLNSI